VQLPESFVKNIRAILPAEADQCLSAIAASPVAASIRLNKHKQSEAFADAPSIAWCNHAKQLSARPSFIADPLFHAGAYYVQESSSMFVAHVLQELRKNFDGNIRVLDLCAAPGGKSTLLLDELDDNDLLVSNEIIKTRVNILEENLVRWGRSNIVISNNDPARIGAVEAFFDLVLIDAPCSGEGMFRKDKNAIAEWSEQHVMLCTQRQQRILADALPALKPGGYLIYSTCTFNHAENEANVKKLIEEGYIPVRIPVNDSWNISVVKEYEGTPMFAYRFYPHKVSGEGFFMACLQKPGTCDVSAIRQKTVKPDRLTAKELDIIDPWLRDSNAFTMFKNNDDVYALPETLVSEMFFLRSVLNVKRSGLKMGTLIKGKLVPDHQLSLSVHLNPSVPAIEADRLQALTFLKKETFPVDPVPQDIYLVKYKGLGLGWVKIMPNRMNNYLPVNWRILKDLDTMI
jgi:16S rRNA C967 or C1407 C5-methylase (RsmB/RsmF family)/NOL1/NOP2/fmu family ribosome biogenesis protein